MRLSVLLVLVLCVLLSAGDRRRSERGDGDQQQRVQHRGGDGDERRHHQHHDNQWRQHHHHDNDDDDEGNDSDDEDDEDGDDEHYHHRFVDLADTDGSHWRRGHDHRGDRPETDNHGRRNGQDSRQDGQKDVKKNGQKDGKKNGQKDGKKGGKKSDNRRSDDSGDGEHHQEDRRRDGNHDSDHHQHHGDASSKNDKKAHHQGGERPQGRQPAQDGAAGASLQSDNPPVAAESSNRDLPLSAAAKPSSPVAESLAAAMAAAEPDTTLSATEDSEEEPGSEPLPPPHQDVAAMARYIVHVSDWAAMATISTRPPTRGMPFANVFSVCDGTRYRSTGIPYLYLTNMEISVQDLLVNNSASLTMSLAQTQFCRQRGYDPEDPLCAHVILSGRVLQVDEQDPEFAFARDALFARHPEMSGWPTGHHFFVAKLDIQNIIVLDYFGGAKTVPVPEYFATNPFKAHPRRANML